METRQRSIHALFGVGMFALGFGLAINTLLGPLFAGVVRYPFTETVLNETLGLEAASLILIAPLAIAAGALALRGHPAAGFVAIGPAGYAAYMLAQYVIGPQYPTYQPSIALHLGLFVLSAGLLMRGWSLAGEGLPAGASRGWAVVVFLLAAFVVSRWAGAFVGMAAGDTVPAHPADVSMYWSIFFLDLGVVVPTAIATGIGLLAGAAWARRAVFGVVGWFALVPPSVAAMAIVKLLRNDPNATVGDTAVLAAVTLMFWLVAVRLYRPLFRRSGLGPAPRRALAAAGAR